MFIEDQLYGCQSLLPRLGSAVIKIFSLSVRPVSYTHLDVYKRQVSANRNAASMSASLDLV